MAMLKTVEVAAHLQRCGNCGCDFVDGDEVEARTISQSGLGPDCACVAIVLAFHVDCAPTHDALAARADEIVRGALAA